MEKIIANLRRLLARHFKGCELELEVNDSNRITGFLIWRGFSGKDQIKRQDKLWKVLDEKLSQKERAAITMIFTMTPNEMAVARAG